MHEFGEETLVWYVEVLMCCWAYSPYWNPRHILLVRIIDFRLRRWIVGKATVIAAVQ